MTTTESALLAGIAANPHDDGYRRMYMDYNQQSGRWDYDASRLHKDCPTCAGTGRVPRPFTGSEQPIVRLVLSTEMDWHVSPGYEVMLTGGGIEYECKSATDGCWWGKEPPVIKQIFAAEWPQLREVVLPS